MSRPAMDSAPTIARPSEAEVPARSSEPVARSPLAVGAWLFGRWEFLLLILLGLVIAYGAHISPFFLVWDNLLDNTSTFMEIAIIALPTTLIIISGNIDLSVASNAAMCSVVCAQLNTTYGVNIWVACLCALAVGTVAGLFNGLVTTKVRIPSLIVTLGTYALFRGIANGLLGSTSISSLPANFVGINYWYIPGTHIPTPLVLFLGLAVLMAFLLNGTVLGRYVFAIGNNAEASRFAGVAVDRIVIFLFALSGFFSALAGLVLTSRVGTSTEGLATNYELAAITAAVLGGANIFGGEGSIIGTVLAVFIIGLLQVGMSLANIEADIQTIAVGSLLILSILIPGTTRRVRAAVARRRGGGL